MIRHTLVAGILSIVSGGFGVLSLVWIILSVVLFRAIFQPIQSDFNAVFPLDILKIMIIIYAVWGFFQLIIAVLAIVGGIYTLKKRCWPLALAGAIGATVAFYPCGIAAVILVSMAKEEFSAASAT